MRKARICTPLFSQAWLEMSELGEAVAAVAYYEQHPVNLKGRTLMVQYSRHPELKTKIVNDAAQHALAYANNVVTNDDHKRVLRVMIDNLLLPVNVDVLHQVHPPHLSRIFRWAPLRGWPTDVSLCVNPPSQIFFQLSP